MSESVAIVVQLTVNDNGVASAIGFPKGMCQSEHRELRARLVEYAVLALARTFTVESDLGIEAALEHLQAKIHRVLMDVSVKYHSPGDPAAPENRVGDPE